MFSTITETIFLDLSGSLGGNKSQTMKRILQAVLIICVLTACKPKVKIVNMEEPTLEPRPVATNIEEAPPQTAPPSTESASEAPITSEALPAATPASLLTEAGEFYLLERASKVTDVGIVAFEAGKKVKFVSLKGTIVTVTDGKNTIEVEATKLTRNIEKGEAIKAKASAEKQGSGINSPEIESSVTAVSDSPPSPRAPSRGVAETLSTETSKLALAPQHNWGMRVGQDIVACQELYRVLRGSTVADSSLKVDQPTEIYEGVKLMMPLREALKILPLEEGPVPARFPIFNEGIPFYYRQFAFKKIPKYEMSVEKEDIFNLLYVITDESDRVVGILLVCENPQILVEPNTDLRYYNFVLNRSKSVIQLKVRSELDVEGDSDLLVLNTWLIDARRELGLEINRWYLPSKVANFIKHVLEIKLGISPSTPPEKKTRL